MPIPQILEALTSDNAFGRERLPDCDEGDRPILAVGLLCAKYNYKHDPKFSIHAHLSTFLGIIRNRIHFGSVWAQLVTFVNVFLQILVHKWLTGITSSHFGRCMLTGGFVYPTKETGCNIQESEGDADNVCLGDDIDEEAS